MANTEGFNPKLDVVINIVRKLSMKIAKSKSKCNFCKTGIIFRNRHIFSPSSLSRFQRSCDDDGKREWKNQMAKNSQWKCFPKVLPEKQEEKSWKYESPSVDLEWPFFPSLIHPDHAYQVFYSMTDDLEKSFVMHETEPAPSCLHEQ